MNRFRINQIMETLLFPYCDDNLLHRDLLLQRCMAYREFLKLNHKDLSLGEEKQIISGKFRDGTQAFIHYLVSRNKGRVKAYDDILLLCDYYYPLLDINRFMEKLQKQKEEKGIPYPYEDNITLFYFKNLQRIAESLLTYRDGVIAIRNWNNQAGVLGDDIFFTNHTFHKVEIWNILSRRMVTDLLIVIFAVDSGYSKAVLYEQKPQISLADKLLIKCLERGMAENHLHFNAGFDYESIWICHMQIAIWRTRGSRFQFTDPREKQQFQCAVFRFLAARFLSHPNGERFSFLPWVQTQWDGIFCSCMEHLYTGNEYCWKEQYIPPEFWTYWEKNGGLEETDYLLSCEYVNDVELKTSSEFLLLYHAYTYVKKHPWETAFASIFLQYIRMKNSLFGEIQQGFFIPGLRHFQEYFKRAKNYGQKSAGHSGLMLDVFRSQAKLVNLKKLEIRIAPSDSIKAEDCFDYERCRSEILNLLYHQLKDIFYLYRKYLLEAVAGVKKTKELLSWEDSLRGGIDFSYQKLTNYMFKHYPGLNHNESVPTLGIIYHFIKWESLDNLSGYCCWKGIEETSVKISSHKFILRQRMVNTAKAIEEIRQSIPGLSQYIVGVDAASDENAMEPWMFSSAYNQMRSRINAKPVAAIGNPDSYELIQNIGFTYHVGEDFRHILSGLRHIDEVIEGFHYKPGDRLGHAIALGISIPQWIADNEILPVPLLEHMENLLWIWGKCTEEGLSLSVHPEVLEEQIFQCAEKIYQRLEGITVRMLYKAYKAKFTENHRTILESLRRYEKNAFTETNTNSDDRCHRLEEAAPYCRYGQNDCGSYQPPWTVEKLISTFYCPVFEEKYSQIILVPISSRDETYYQELQTYLLHKVEQRGIFVETNPTSNLTIGDFSDFQSHPIFQMNSKFSEGAKNQVMVTVNSDDPAVFHTNVENELAYIYYAAEYSGYPKEVILSWIDQIRQNGMEASFIKKVKSAGQLLEEISRILDYIDQPSL